MTNPLPGYLFSGSRKWTDFYIVDLLICGLRYYSRLHREKVIIVHGKAPGADTIAGKCAEREGLEVHDYPAEWSKHDDTAGPIRNQQMLDEEDVKVVFCFHDDLRNSKGTRDMASRALKAGLPVYQIKRIHKEDL